MLNEALRQTIQEAMRHCYQRGGDKYDAKKAAHFAAIQYGRERSLLNEPLTDEEQAAIAVAVEKVIRQTPIKHLLALLSLEFIGENYSMYRAYKERGRATQSDAGTERYGAFLGNNKSRPWVARITGFDQEYEFARKFLYGRIDYSRASSNGSRGVYLHFYLRPGIYEVNERISWKNVRRYFIRVDGMTITEITKSEVEQWLQME